MVSAGQWEETLTGRIADPTLWREGAERIAWARQFMPATTALAAELRENGRVRGIRIAVSDVLEPKTATVALLLAEAGADVAVTCVGRDTDDAVAAALVHAGIPTYAHRGATDAEDRDNVLALLLWGVSSLVMGIRFSRCRSECLGQIPR